MKHLAIILLTLVFSCVGVAQDLSLERGKTLLKSGAYKEALAHFNAMLEKQADNREAQELLIRAQIETGDYAAAEKRVKDFLAKAPAEAPLRVALGDIEFETGR